MTSHQNSHQTALELFRQAKATVTTAGFGWEANWQRSVEGKPFGERDLLSEAAWVVLCSGFRESAVRAVFDHVSLCFCDWESAAAIAAAGETCVRTAYPRFRNTPKLMAILNVARIIASEGFGVFAKHVRDDPRGTLRSLPFIGPVTWAHLAKNLGINVAKDDRHLARLASRFGHSSAQSLCDMISGETGEPASVVDVILWRFASLPSSAAQ